MAAQRLSMRKLGELFRPRYEAKLTTRSIATSLGIGNGTVCDSLGRARATKLPWPLPPELDDDAVLTVRDRGSHPRRNQVQRSHGLLRGRRRNGLERGKPGKGRTVAADGGHGRGFR